ncbi:MAG: dCTP deaminase [Prosthecobacter sp.]
MIINGEQLKQLAIKHEIVSNVESAFDGNSLELTLSDTVCRIKSSGEPLRYGEKIPAELIQEDKLNSSLALAKGDCVLACSRERVKIPAGYLGFIQTKGSLARHFVSVACFDGQIDSGFEGPVTFEIVSHSDVQLIIPVGAKVARLFLIKCSSKLSPPYNGRYKNAVGPTEPRIS